MEVDYVRVYQKGRIPSTITFPAIPTKTLGAPAFALTATASSGLPVSYATTSDKITISGTTVTLVKAGRVSIGATQDGNDVYAGAALAQQNFCVNPAKPTITTSGMDSETVLTSSAAAGNQWFFNGAPISGAVNATLAASSAGVYTVRVTVDDCVSDFSSETSVIVTGDLDDSGNSVDVYPNPVENYLEVSGLPGEIISARLYDLAGRYSKLAFENSGPIRRANVQHLAQGIYLLRIQAGDMTYQFKVIKK